MEDGFDFNQFQTKFLEINDISKIISSNNDDYMLD